MAKYRIDVQTLQLKVGQQSVPGAHNYLVLSRVNSDGSTTVLSALHGMATNRKTNEIAPIGANLDKYGLHGVHAVYDAKYLSNLPNELKAKGPDGSYLSYRNANDKKFRRDAFLPRQSSCKQKVNEWRR